MRTATPRPLSESGVTLSSERRKLVPDGWRVFFVVVFLLFVLFLLNNFNICGCRRPHLHFSLAVTSVSVEPNELAVN